jgi:hypothetical protein
MACFKGLAASELPVGSFATQTRQSGELEFVLQPLSFKFEEAMRRGRRENLFYFTFRVSLM